MSYMASCGGPTCTSFNNTDAQWFKIAESGQKPGDATWYQDDLTKGDGYSLTLPANLAPGAYLLRNEIISLQLAATLDEAEFYVSCTQLSISGSGSGVPSPTVKFPGAYTATDQGILTPDVYNPGFQYQFPGGAVSNLASPSYGTVPALPNDGTFVTGTLPADTPPPAQAPGSGSPTSSNSSSSASPSPTPNTGSGSNSTSSGSGASAGTQNVGGGATCKLRPVPEADSANSTARKREHGRMMRRFRRTSA